MEVNSTYTDSMNTSYITEIGNDMNITTEGPFLHTHSLEELYVLYRPAISIVDRWLTPIWYIVGFPGNILALLVWIQPKMRPSSGCYLAALAMADLAFLFLQFLFELQNTWGIRVLMVPVLCELYPVLFLAAQYLDPLLVLGFTVERYIAICHPFQREKYCSTSRAIKCIIGLTVLSLLLHVIQAYFWHYYLELKECSIREEVLLNGLWTAWSWTTELLVFGAVPITILVLNIIVITETRKLRRSEEKLLCLKKGQHKKSSSASATTFMLLAVSFYLIFTTLPVTILYAMGSSFPPGSDKLSQEEIFQDPTWQRHFTYYAIKIVVQELGMSHYACNFYIYLLTGMVFRKELLNLFYKTCCRGMSDRIWNSELEDMKKYQEQQRLNTKQAQNGHAENYKL